MAHRYRKRPVVVHAMRWTGPEMTEALLDWAGQPDELLWEPEIEGPAHPASGQNWGRLSVQTLEGEHVATPGDWLVCGVAGELYFCKPDIFEATYEPA
jgi:hypothetical protein